MGSKWGHPSPGVFSQPVIPPQGLFSHAVLGPAVTPTPPPHPPYLPVIVLNSTLLPPLQHLQVKITACGGFEKCQGL